MSRTPPYSRRHDGFTLIELLTVIAIIGMIAVFTTGSIGAIARASNLTSAGQMLVDNLNLARQIAMTKNRRVEVRISQLASASNASERACRAIQLFTVESAGLVPATRLILLPSPIVFSESSGAVPNLSSTTSSLLASQSGTNAFSLPSVGTNYQYASFHFRPNGETDLDPSKVWVATLIASNDPIKNNGLPANTFTVRLNPSTGKVQVFR